MGRDQIYHEVELGVVIGKTGKSISESQAMDHVGGPDYNFFLGLGWAIRPNEKIWDYYDSLFDF